jgi:hypothetical protein
MLNEKLLLLLLEVIALFVATRVAPQCPLVLTQRREVHYSVCAVRHRMHHAVSCFRLHMRSLCCGYIQRLWLLLQQYSSLGK